MGIDHQKIELFFLPFLVNGAQKHTAGVDAHHGPERQICDGDAGLSNQLLRLIKGVDAAEDGPRCAGAVVQGELQELLGLGYCLAFEDLYSAEIGLGEGLEIHRVGKEGFDHHV